MPAAAIPEGAEVIIPREANEDDPAVIHVVVIENSTPRPGLITWYSEEDLPYIIGASTDVVVVSLPDAAIEAWNKIGARK